MKNFTFYRKTLTSFPMKKKVTGLRPELFFYTGMPLKLFLRGEKKSSLSKILHLTRKA